MANFERYKLMNDERKKAEEAVLDWLQERNITFVFSRHEQKRTITLDNTSLPLTSIKITVLPNNEKYLQIDMSGEGINDGGGDEEVITFPSKFTDGNKAGEAIKRQLSAREGPTST